MGSRARTLQARSRPLDLGTEHLSGWAHKTDADLDLAGWRAEAERFENQFGSKSIYERAELLAQIFPRITLAPSAINLEVDAAAFVAVVIGTGTSTASKVDSSATIKISLPLLVKRRGNEARIIIEGKSDRSCAPDPGLINLVSKAQAYLFALTDGSGLGLAELAVKTGTHIADVSRVLPLAFLAPSIIDAIHSGRQPPHLTARYLSRLNELPVEWHRQRAVLGF